VPGKRFQPVNPNAVCVFMKMITLRKVRDALRDWQFEVTVDADIAAQARGAIDRMVALG
jgi:quinolinate synthase